MLNDLLTYMFQIVCGYEKYSLHIIIYTPDFFLPMIRAITMINNTVVTIKEMAEAITTGTVMLFSSVGTWVTGI